MNRDLDGKIAKDIFNWKYTHVGPDCFGQNQCEILSENGKFPEGVELPLMGKVHEAYLAPLYSNELKTALELAKHVELNIGVRDLPLDPEKIAQMSYDFYMWKKECLKDKMIVNSIGNRGLDATIAKTIFGWKYVKYGQGKILTHNGEKPARPRGSLYRVKLQENCFVPNYSSNIEEALKLAKHVGLKTIFDLKTFDPEKITAMCHDYYVHGIDWI